MIKHSLIKPDTIESRIYQENILNTAIRKNTLCVLPTGLGKTTLAVLVSAYRLENFPEKKILVMSPTRPLCAQHQKYFRKTLDINEKEIMLITGFIRPEDRKELYKKARIIIATPQTIRNDIQNQIIDMNDFSLLIFDECHRAVKDYSYTFVAREYKKVKDNLILGLTASPGSTKEKIDEICRNLLIESVEIRTETDEDVKPYMKKIKIDWIRVDLPENLKNAQENLKIALKKRIDKLKEFNIHIKRQRDLLDAQKRISKRINTEKKPILFYVITKIVEAIKIWHLLELLETQSVNSTRKYLEKIRLKKTRSDKGILADEDFKKAIKIIESSEEHPKIKKLKEVIEKEIENKEISIIIFSHFRDNIHYIQSILKPICSSAILIGQAGEKGLSQKEQIGIIKDFNAGVYNCLITSPIGEEGLHIPSADLAIFYDSVPSEIRTIQRRGRVGRTKVGRIIFLLTRKTRDEAYYWTSYRREKKMKTILKDMQESKSISDFI
ncbi:MAG: DEAD/DEAH box helicase [Candidatus Aenigmatarchaeota archaeon]